MLLRLRIICNIISPKIWNETSTELKNYFAAYECTCNYILLKREQVATSITHSIKQNKANYIKEHVISDRRLCLPLSMSDRERMHAEVCRGM